MVRYRVRSRIATKTLWRSARWVWWQTDRFGERLTGVSSAEQRNSRISDKTLWSATRRAWWWAGTLASVSGRATQVGNLRQDPMQRHTVAGWQVGTLGEPSSGVSPVDRLGSGSSDKTLCNVARWPGGGPGRSASRRAGCPRLNGSIRGSRTRPYATWRGGRVADVYAREPSAGVSPVGRGKARLADKTLCNVVRLGSVAGIHTREVASCVCPTRRCDAGISDKTLCNVARLGFGGRACSVDRRAACPRPSGAKRASQTRPHATSCGWAW
jgi:hypothetical protein